MRHVPWQAKALPWVLVVGLLSALIVMRAYGDVGYAKLADAQARIDSLAPIVAAHKAETTKADTVLIQVTDTLTVVIQAATARAEQATDSVRAHVDSVGAVHLDSLVASHERHVAAVQAVADARLVWGTTWRDYAHTLEQQNAELQIANTLSYAMLRTQRRQNVMLKAGAIILAGAVLYGAVK